METSLFFLPQFSVISICISKGKERQWSCIQMGRAWDGSRKEMVGVDQNLWMCLLLVQEICRTLAMVTQLVLDWFLIDFRKSTCPQKEILFLAPFLFLSSSSFTMTNRKAKDKMSGNPTTSGRQLRKRPAAAAESDEEVLSSLPSKKSKKSVANKLTEADRQAIFKEMTRKALTRKKALEEKETQGKFSWHFPSFEFWIVLLRHTFSKSRLVRQGCPWQCGGCGWRKQRGGKDYSFGWRSGWEIAWSGKVPHSSPNCHCNITSNLGDLFRISNSEQIQIQIWLGEWVQLRGGRRLYGGRQLLALWKRRIRSGR